MKNVIIIGAGGHAKVITDIIVKCGDSVVGFLDSIRTEANFLGYPILGKEADWKSYSDCYFIIAIGNSKVREKIYKNLKTAKWYTAIHPNASISSIGAKIGFGTVIMSNAVINTDTIIGKHCIINSSSTVEHDNNLSDFVHVSVGAKLAGHVTVGKHTWIGVGSTIINDISVCDNCMIGAGAVVIRNIKKSGTYVGVPAKFIHD